MHMKGEPMAGKENREIKNSVFVDLFYEDESAEANEIALFLLRQKKYHFENSYRSYCLHGISESSVLPAAANHGLH